MIGSKCRRRRSNQFNNVLITAQDKVIYNKITEIREERNANSIYTGSVTSKREKCLRLVLKKST